MSPVGKALWYIESHFAGGISLDDIAAAGNVSRYHMSRAFEMATGHSVMGYVRRRRLSEAARCLAEGAPDILSLAIAWGYGSHEAFTRAFRDQFGLTPEQLRAQRRLDSLELVEPIKMDQTLLETLAPPHFVSGKSMLIAGLSERYDCDSSRAIPALWQRFAPHLGNVDGQVGEAAYGVRYNADDDGHFDYMSGVEVADFSGLPGEFARLRIPAQRYAVFSHRDHISTIRRTHNTVWNSWLPDSGHSAADAPAFERYGKEFNQQTGTGGVEIWLPIKG